MGTQVITWHSYDWLTGNYVGDLPLRSAQFGSEVDHPAQWSGVIDLRDPYLEKIDLVGLTTPNKRVLVADYNGAPVFAGLLQQRADEFSSTTGSTSHILNISGAELEVYLAQRTQATDYSAPPYSGIYPNPTVMPIWNALGNVGALSSSNSLWDPLLIAAQVVSDMLGYTTHTYGGLPTLIPNGNPLGGLSIGYAGYSSLANYTSSGNNTPAANYISYTAPFSSLQTVDAILSQLAGLGYGVSFDYALDAAYVTPQQPSSGLVGTVNLSYPRRGRTINQQLQPNGAGSALYVDLTQALSYSFSEDGVQQAWAVYEVGGGQAINVSENTAPGNQGYALYERTFTRSQIMSANVENILSSVAYTDLNQDSYPQVAPEITIDLFGQPPSGTPQLVLGTFIAGDDVQIYMPQYNADGALFDPRFPNGLNSEWRIIEWQANVADQGVSTLALTLNVPPVLLPSVAAI